MSELQGGFGAFIPLLIMWIPFIFVCRRLAQEKHKNVALWTVLAIIPLVNWMVAIPYLLGSTNLVLEEKLDKALAILERHDVGS